MMAKFASQALTVIILTVAFVVTGGCNNAAPDKGSTPKKEVQAKSEVPFVATIPHMQDEGCVASIKEQVEKLPWVAKVECDIPQQKATVTPKAGAKTSARELWEALDRAGESASKLDGPSGLFTAKPEK